MREKTNENQILPERTFNEARPVEHKHMPSLCRQRKRPTPGTSRFMVGHRCGRTDGKDACFFWIILDQRSRSSCSQRLNTFHSCSVLLGRTGREGKMILFKIPGN